MGTRPPSRSEPSPLTGEGRPSRSRRGRGEGSSRAEYPSPRLTPKALATPLPQEERGRVCVAQIGAPHGVRGEVRLRAFTQDPMALMRYGALEAEDGSRAFELEAVRPAKSALVARFSGVTNRDAAAELRNVKLYVSRARLPEPEDEAYYHRDLIGLAAVDPDGAAVGTVCAVQNFGAGDLIEIAPAAGGPSVLLPFTKAYVPVVDIPAGRVVLERLVLEPSPKGRG